MGPKEGTLASRGGYHFVLGHCSWFPLERKEEMCLPKAALCHYPTSLTADQLLLRRPVSMQVSSLGWREGQN